MTKALLLLICAGGAIGLWSFSVRGRERVLAITAEICRELTLQRLDDSVVLRGVALVRDNPWSVLRRYEFDFSTDGADRRRGQIILMGLALHAARLDLPSGPLHLDLSGR